MPRESKSIWGKIVVGRNPRGEKVMGKVYDFDAKSNAELRMLKGPTGGVERMKVTIRKTTPVPDAPPAFLVKGKKRAGK